MFHRRRNTGLASNDHILQSTRKRSIVFSCKFIPEALIFCVGSPLESGPTTTLPDRKLLVFILHRLQKKDTHVVFSEPVNVNLNESPPFFRLLIINVELVCSSRLH